MDSRILNVLMLGDVEVSFWLERQWAEPTEEVLPSQEYQCKITVSNYCYGIVRLLKVANIITSSLLFPSFSFPYNYCQCPSGSSNEQHGRLFC